MSETLPEEMTAIEISSPGGPEVLKPVTMRRPYPEAGEFSDQGGGCRRQPARHAAAPGPLPAAPGRSGDARPWKFPVRSLSPAAA